MFNVLDIHNKYTVRIFIVSLYKITKIIEKPHPHPHPPLTSVDVPPHLLLELMSLTRVRCTLRGGVRWGGTLVGGGGFVGCWIRWGGTLGGGGYVGGGGGVISWGGGESGTSTREDRSKTAQKPLKSCLKNRSKITVRNERFFTQDLSGLSGFSKKTAQFAQTAQTAQILLENRSNRSNLERFLSGISTRVDQTMFFPYWFHQTFLEGPCELRMDCCTHRVISDKVHRLLVTILFSAG